MDDGEEKNMNEYEKWYQEKLQNAHRQNSDDVFTPPLLMEKVYDYVEQKFGVSKERFVRPFYPGGDYENFEYPEGCIVVDNPPFSIITKIVRFYNERSINYCLFAPALTAASIPAPGVIWNFNVTYDNGVQIQTALVTSLSHYAEADPELKRKCADKKEPKKLTKIDDSIIRGATFLKAVRHNESFKIDLSYYERARKVGGQAIYGGAFIPKPGSDTALGLQASSTRSESDKRKEAGNISEV